MDRVYKADIPQVIDRLEKLESEFAKFEPTTDWASLRIEPLLNHAKRLDEVLKSKRFSSEIDRLRRGVDMFHADLVYFRDNIRGLNNVLESEKKAAARRRS
jgi:hypothetical protein